jgi:restriction system protein
VWLVLAALAFFGLHALAGLKPSGKPAEVMSQALWRSFAIVGQFLVPLGLVLIAAVSAVIRRRPSRAPHLYEETGTPTTEQRLEPTLNTDLYGVWKEAAQVPSVPITVDTTRWSLELLKALEWKRLEQFSAVYFRTLGFRVEEADPGPDGGVDLRLYERHEKRPGILVQCKAWNSWKVGVKEIREHFGVMAAEEVSEGIFVTTSTFTEGARQFVRGKNIALIDGGDLLRKIQDLHPEDQEHILGLVTEGDFTTPTCPSCGIKMVRRVAQSTGQPFWGCLRFPRCRTKIAIGK